MRGRCRVLWTHNFDPAHPGAGVFMYTLADAVRAAGVDVELRYLGNLRQPSTIWRALTTLRREAAGFDLVHAQFGSLCGLMSSICGVPKLLTLRGSDLYYLTDGPWGLRLHGRLAHFMTRLSLYRYERVIVMSNCMKDFLSTYFEKKCVEVVPDGIDLSLFQPVSRDLARIRLGCAGNDRPWVLFPTMHASNPIKRTELAVEAIRYLTKWRPDVEFKLVTNVPHQKMPYLINASSVVLMTSAHEGWPNIIKEALACNVPFVSTDVSDLKHIAAVEDACSVVDPEPELLAKALLYAIGSPRSDSLRTHVSDMDHAATAARIVRLYEQVVAAR